MPNVGEVIETALAMSVGDRSYIASKLIESLEQDELSDHAVTEYDQRVGKWRTGESPSSSSQELDAKVQAILNR